MNPKDLKQIALDANPPIPKPALIENQATLGLPHWPSSFGRTAACPASMSRQALCPDDAGEAATRGTRIHTLFAGGVVEMPKGQSDEDYAEEIEVAQDARVAWGDFVDQYRPTSAMCGCNREYPVKICLADGVIITGTPDIFQLFVCGETALLFDLKAGRVPVAAPDVNPQIHCYALAIHQLFGVETVVAAIFQPRVSRKNQVAAFDFSDGRAAEYQAALLEVVVAACKIDPEVRPGAHCSDKYCAARFTCQEGLDWSERRPVVFDGTLGPKGIGGIEQATDAQLSFAKNVQVECARISSQANTDKVNAEIIRRDGVPGWTVEDKLGNRRVREEIGLRSALGFTEREYSAMRKPPAIGAMEKKYGDLNALKGKDLKDSFNLAAGDLIVRPETKVVVREETE